MDPAGATALREAIRNLHDCDSLFMVSIPVREEFQGKVVWEGEVQVFKLFGHPTATRCYAWSRATDGARRRFYALLHAPPVDSAVAAVRASIVAGARARKQ